MQYYSSVHQLKCSSILGHLAVSDRLPGGAPQWLSSWKSDFFVGVTITLFTWTGNQVEPGSTKPKFDLVSICFWSHNSNLSTHCIIVSRWRWKSVFLSCGCALCTQYVTGLIHSPTLSAKLQSAFRSNSVHISPFLTCFRTSYLGYQGRIRVNNPGLTLVNGSM